MNSKKGYRELIKTWEKDYPYLKDVPHNCKEWAMRDAQANIKSCFTNKLRGNISKFKTPFRSKKNPSQVLTIRSQNISKDLKIYPRLLFKKDMYNKKQKYIQNMKKFDLNIADKKDSKLIWEKSTNEWYLCLTTKVEKNQHQADHENRVVSLDPGNRTFATWYSPTAGIGKIGDGDGEKLVKIGYSIDKLISLKSKSHGRKKRNLNKVIGRLSKRLLNLRRDFHNKTASWLTEM